MNHHFLENAAFFPGFLRSFSRKLHFNPLKKKQDPRYRQFFVTVCRRICLNHTFPHFSIKSQLFTASTDYYPESQGKFSPTLRMRERKPKVLGFF